MSNTYRGVFDKFLEVMKKYSNSKAKRLANQGKAPEVDEEAEIDTLRTRRVEEAPESGSQLQR